MIAYWLRIAGAWTLLYLAGKLVKDSENLLKTSTVRDVKLPGNDETWREGFLAPEAVE